MGYTGPIWKLGDKDNFSAEVMKLMLNRDGTPVIVSEHNGIFTMVMPLSNTMRRQ